jgi:hypothetical protein
MSARACTVALGLAILGSSCAGAASGDVRAVPAYDLYSGRLIQLNADQNGDGRIDQWTYLDGNTPLRGESDADGDGRIDRWEYFDANAQLVRVGTASLNDGLEDTWAYPADANGERRIAHSRRRDRHVDRQEFFRGETLVRAEEDTNADGRTDRWDRFDGSIMREVAFDMTMTQGRPTRRLLYDEKGRFVAVEDDLDGDGTFVRLTGDAAAAAAKAGVKE